MFLHIFCGLLLLNAFAAEAETHSCYGLEGGFKKVLKDATAKISRVFDLREKSYPEECHDYAPDGCRQLYKKGVCKCTDLAKYYCRLTCGYCKPNAFRWGSYIMSDEWDKIPRPATSEPSQTSGESQFDVSRVNIAS